MDKKNPKDKNPAVPPEKPRFASIFIIFFVLTFLFFAFSGFIKKPEPVSIEVADYSEFIASVDQSQVDTVYLGDDGITIKYTLKGAEKFITYEPRGGDPTLVDRLTKHDVKIKTKAPTQPGFFSNMLTNPMWVFIFVVVGIAIWQSRKQAAMMKGMGGAGGTGQADAFGKSKAVVRQEENIKVRFADVHAPDAIEQMREAVELLKNPELFAELGASMPRGVALVGPPGTGKTLLAKAVAGEAGVPFLSLSGSDFAEMFVGVAAARVRDLFEQGRKNAPCIIFIDEVDSIGGKRSASPMGGEKETEGGLNALLAQLDGFDTLNGVLFMCATNRAENLDPALLRPGRIDRHIELLNPDLLAREEIFKIHMRGKPIGADVLPRDLARGTSGMNGGQLAAICNEAALCAARTKKKVIDMRDFEQAKDKVLMGRENKTMLMTDLEKKLTAYHEAGHTIVGHLAPEHDPVYKVSIIPRTMALGITMFLPERDQVSATKRKLKSMLWTAYAGRIAEEMIFGPDGVTTGAQNDEQRATQIAKNMVMLWDMSGNEKLRHMTFLEDGSGLQHLGGRGMVQGQTGSETAQIIDDEVRKIIHEAYKASEDILQEYRNHLDVMAEALLKWETIGREQVLAIMEGKSLDEVPAPVGFDEVPVIITETVSS